jgi:hypothetical protein
MENNKLSQLLEKLDSSTEININDDDMIVNLNDALAMKIQANYAAANTGCSNNTGCTNNNVCSGNNGCNGNSRCQA